MAEIPMLELVHLGGARKDVDVLTSGPGNYPILILHWPLAGMYALDLQKNVLRVEDATHNRRKILPWRAVDIELARELWKKFRTEKLRVLRPMKAKTL